MSDPTLTAQARFTGLMAELFQLDEAEALDFGIYRVIRRHNREVRAFLGGIVDDAGGRRLEGGVLSQKLDEAFAAAEGADDSGSRQGLQALAAMLKITPGMPEAQIEAQLAKAEEFRRDEVREYRDLRDTLQSAATRETDRSEVLNRLYQFFSRHYQDGDFIVERRYGQGGVRYIKSTGEDTEFHWATEDMYYIKSGDIFTDFPVRLANGRRVVFTVDPDSLHATRAALKPNDKTHYALGRVDVEEDRIRVTLRYEKDAQGAEAKKAAIVSAIQSAGAGASEAAGQDLRRWLNRFIARNQSDFFIHKRLKAALTEDLDFFIKTTVLDTGQLLAGAEVAGRVLKVARLVREIGGHIIAFLATLEDFQKALWEQPKLVFDTRYVITLDRLHRNAPDWLAANLAAIVETQREEWRGLGLGDYATPADCRRRTEGDLMTPATEHYLPLPVDTGHFGEEFKWSLLAAVTASVPLDAALDGVAIQSDNWQALNTLREKYREQVKCIYIDPPYNTGGDGFPYEDAYPHASWMAMMQDRLDAAAPFLQRNGALFASIDHVERNGLTEALARALGRKNRVEEIIWGQNTTKNQSPTYSTNHEYVEVYARELAAASSDPRMFREPKPGAAEVLELVERLNPDYPPTAAILRDIKTLFEQHRAEFRAELEESGIDYDKNLDPWKGLYNYWHAEYRDDDGRYILETEAKVKEAKIWIWKEGDSSMPKGGGTDNKPGCHTPVHPDYRFYKPKHPLTGEACPQPKRGWVWPELPAGLSSSFKEMAEANRIVWGPSHKKVPQQKKFLHEVDTQVSKSLVLDYADGEKELTHLTNKSRSFPNPKPTTLIERFILQTTETDEWVMDFFAGSATTFHAAVSAQHDDRKRRKVLLIEAGAHFDSTLLPRIKKVTSAGVWRDGQPLAVNGSGLFLRVQRLEQYEDTLENLAADVGEDATADLFAADDPFALRYRLDQTTRAMYCGVDHFMTPLGYRMQRAQGGGAAVSCPVDLIESLIYRLGIAVRRLYREPLGVVVRGDNRWGQSVAVFFRDCGAEGSASWVEQKLAEHPTDRVYANDPARLGFAGCETLEAIEAAFVWSFGRT